MATTQNASDRESQDRSSRNDAATRGRSSDVAERELIARVAQTRRAVRRVDLAAALCANASLGLALLLIGVLLDHWALAQGLSQKGRLSFAVFWCGAVAIFLVVKLVPVFRRRVNALYAAKTLEEATEDRHNLIVNWFLLRRDSNAKDAPPLRSDLAAQIALQAQKQARTIRPDETNVDCSSVIRWGIVFATLVAISLAYTVFSPKNPFASVARIAAPFAEIERPQALKVERVLPGDALAYQGDFLEIEATIPGADENSNVELLYSTEDGRLVDASIKMENLGGAKFKSTFPDTEEGLAENVLYRVVVARGGRFESSSALYKIVARPQPSCRVEKMTLVFPEYAATEPQTFENQGDVRALENTRVELEARSNAAIKRAFLIPDGDRARATPFQVSQHDPTLASISFALQWKDHDAEIKKPEFQTYQIVSETEDGEKNRDVQDYCVSIVEDQPPTVRWLDEEQNLDVQDAPLNESFLVQLVGEDPDFALRRAELRFARAELAQGDQRDAAPPPDPIPFKLRGGRQGADYSTGPSPYVGEQLLETQFVPEALGLAVGDEIECWAVVEDSKLPNPNVVASEKRVFVVSDPVADPAPPKREEEAPSSSAGRDEGQGAGNDQNAGESASQNSSESNGANGGGESESGGEGTDAGADSGGEGASGSSNDAASDSSETNDRNQSAGNGTSETGGDAQDGEGGSSEGESTSNADDANGGDQTEGATDSNAPGAANDAPAEGSGDDSSNETGESSNGTEGTEADGDGATDPQDAFDKILEYAQKERQKEENGVGQGRDGDEKGDARGGGGDGEKEQGGDPQNAVDATEEVEPNFQSDAKPRETLGELEAPTRTSPDKPSDDADAYRAKNPQKIDPNAARNRSDDVEGNDYLAQNADPNAAPNSQRNNRERENIVADPLDQSDAVAADAFDRNAQEVKGADANGAPDAPFEIDREGDAQGRGQSELDDQDATREQGNSSSGDDRADGAQGNGAGQDDGRSDASGGGDQGGGKNDDRASAASGGRGENNAQSQGGGGGSGLGDLESNPGALAPADAPNLQFAEEATNLVLRYLDDAMKDDARSELLQELGWTDDELREFMQAWKKLRDDAARDKDGDAKKKYLDALEQLRFEQYARPDDARRVDDVFERTDRNRRDNLSAREAARVKTPKRLEERVRAFTRGVAKRGAN